MTTAGRGAKGTREVRVRPEGPAEPVLVETVIDDGRHSGRGRITVLQLRWSPDDPLAVELVLSAQPEHPALPRGRWVILRDFLAYSLEEPTGDGAVRLRPDERRDRLWLELERPGRAASVSVPRQVVRDFLAQTSAAVPFGEERSAEAIDELLSRLLGSG